MKTAQSIEEQKAQSGADNSKQNRKERRIARLAPWRWKRGQSGNPGGRPKNDLAKIIAQAVFEENADAIYAAMGAALLSGNAYTFKELAERAFGKLTEPVKVSGDESLIKLLQSRRDKLAKK